MTKSDPGQQAHAGRLPSFPNSLLVIQRASIRVGNRVVANELSSVVDDCAEFESAEDAQQWIKRMSDAAARGLSPKVAVMSLQDYG